MKLQMGMYYNLTGLGRIKTVGYAKNCETQKEMVIFATVQNGGYHGETLLLNKEDFIERITK